MWCKQVFLLALVAGALQLSASSEASGQNTTIIKLVNATTPTPSPKGSKTSTLVADSLETAPSITSVHQVWTSSSSGSLDELSPEVISKLRQDVPFLAAYALRPRLIGAVPTTVLPQTRQQLYAAELVPGAGSQKLDTSSSNGAPFVVTGLKGASSKASARQIASSSLFPKLGDFSEFNVETSSTSKSEHHHKRKTSLKRPGGKIGGLPEDQERTTAIGSSQRVKRRRAKATSTRTSSKSSKRSVSRQRSNKRRSRVDAPSDRLKQAKSKKLNIVKNGRYFQEGSIETKPDSNELDVEMQALGRDTTTLMMEDGTKTSTGDGSGVKGGSARNPNKTPFYASKRPEPKLDQADSDEALSSSGRERGSSSGSSGTSSTTESSNRVDGPAGEEVGELDDDEPEPMRVGEPDLEEDGDTVLVEPKSDGVDDDPPLPDEDPAASPDANDQVGDPGSGSSAGADTTKVAAEGDRRGHRIDRDRPNPLPTRADEGDDDEQDGSGGGQVAGGGIGTTLGRAGSDGSSDNGVSSVNSPSGTRDSPSSTESSAGGEKKFTESGVEFADEEQDREAGGAGGQSEGRTSVPEAGGAHASSGRDDEGEFGERRKATPMRPRGSGERGPELDDELDDLDYRDEIDSSRDGAKRADGSGARREHHHSGQDEADRERKDPPSEPGHKGTPASAGSGSHGQHCDDGSYNHHDDHHSANHHHGNHHDTIEWLRGAIPGEPEEDYPILSRVNGSNFKCSEQKYPGYYADVESRCQIFHICQADGRQDSFLCPNGTIFSQKTLVCVWWKGFNCEDAPKFYHLNQLLYKSSAASDSPQAAALPGLMMRPVDDSSNKMSALKPRGMAAAADAADGAEDGGSSIEGLVRMMRDRATPRETETIDDGRPGGARGPAYGPRRLPPNDEASIQRKSTNLDEESAGLDERARLRSRDNIPRRRRRASIRQAPPKLKSRRVPRNSRRQKLRHSFKPRRRA